LQRGAILDNHGNGAFAAGDGGGKLEAGAGVAQIIDVGFTFPGLFAIDASNDGNPCPVWDAAFRAIDVEAGGNRIAGAVAVAYKDYLALQTWGAIGPDVELTFGRSIAGEGIRDANDVFASGLACRNIPGKSHDAVDDRGDTGCNSVALRSFDFDERRTCGSRRNVTIRTEDNAANIEFFTRAVDGFVGGDMGEIAFRGARISRKLRRGRRAAKRKAANDDNAGDSSAEPGKIREPNERTD